MAAVGFTHSELAAKLVEGCVAHIAGNVRGKMPVTPVPITELERADVGLKQGGQTLLYPVNKDGGVFLDMHGSTATIWYINGDYDRGLAAVEGVLKASGRAVRQLKDVAQSVPKHRARSYEVELGGGRLAHVIAEYAERGARTERFLVRVVAQVRKK